MAQHAVSVAIVMRTKDRPVLLDRAIADVCAQTFSGWQLVIVSDGESDAATESIVRRHEAALAGRVTVLRNEVSRGMEAASNQGIKATDSAYIAIHDDDDTWHPEFLRRTVAHLDATSDAAVAVRTEIVWEDVDGDKITEQGREVFCSDVHSFTLSEMLRHNRTVPISVLYRRAVHDEIGYFREDLTAVGDWEFWLRLALTAHSLGFLDGDPLAFWHQRRGAKGPMANSVIAQDSVHKDLDLLLRDEALRFYARNNGIGDLLYLTRYLGQENDQLRAQQHEIIRLLAEQNRRMSRLEMAISDASLVSFARRRYRRLRERLRSARRT
jgi:glycosyltransferase involved in cell wall biosynthesis